MILHNAIAAVFILAIPFICFYVGLSIAEVIIVALLYIILIKIQTLIDAKLEMIDAIDELVTNKNSDESTENQDNQLQRN